jgi:hypothetical protein
VALVNQESGAIEWGAGIFTGLATATPLTLYPPQAPGTDNRTNLPFPTSVFASTSGGRGTQSMVINVAANEGFNLDYQFTTDGGTTWYIGDQVASSTVTVDGGAAGYTNVASLNLQLGFQYRFQIYNNSGSTLNGVYEWRLYSDNN